MTKINANDKRIMEEAYAKEIAAHNGILQGSLSAPPADWFISQIAFRAYTEHCNEINPPASPGEYADPQKSPAYTPQPFIDWINAETHHAMERAGYKWIENHFEGNGDSQQAYQDMRQRVLSASVKKSIELVVSGLYWDSFEPKDHIVPKPTTPNLRGSLESYLQ